MKGPKLYCNDKAVLDLYRELCEAVSLIEKIDPYDAKRMLEASATTLQGIFNDTVEAERQRIASFKEKLESWGSSCRTKEECHELGVELGLMQSDMALLSAWYQSRGMK